MNKIIILPILAATILIAGIFAFIPVEKATTVHDEIFANTFTPRIVTGSCETDGDNNNGVMDDDDNQPCDVTINIAEGVPFQVIGVEGSITNRNDDESFDYNRLCYGPDFSNMGFGMGWFEAGSIDQRVATEDSGDILRLLGLGAGTLTMDNEVRNEGDDDPEVEVVTINIIMLMPLDAPDPVLTYVDDLPSGFNCSFPEE